MTAIILAGGMGTRLQSAVSDVPKPMAPVDGRPFLEYLLEYLSQSGISRIVLSIGYKGGIIEECFGDNFQGVPVFYSNETSPLDTGGAIKLALDKCGSGDVIVLNGDTFFDVDLWRLSDAHISNNADITVSLKMMYDIDRYGVVDMDAGRIVSMREKGYAAQGHINGGVYCLRPGVFDGFASPEKFSFEKFLVDSVDKLNILGFPADGNFIDIGIPEDYEAAQTFLPKWVKL